MNIVAINGSPRRGKISKTYWLLEAFLNGCQDEGADVTLINLRDYDIKFCTGCYTCWTKTPGVCALKDDMPKVLEQLEKADVEVWATPLYVFGPTALFKNFVDRTITIMEPFFVLEKGLCTHPHRRPNPPSKVIMSVCGFPELDHFKPMAEWFRFMEDRGGGKIVAEIYRPAAEFLIAPPFQAKREEILEATRKAGQELVRDGAVSQATLDIIQQDIMDQATFIEMGNKYWQWEIDRAAQKPKNN
ncbi:MAG: flavodoxin family protein [Syntrophomonadaceae bacterium]|nr:flavodoxin family protein [Syntrophomonadaceae bacterium]